MLVANGGRGGNSSLVANEPIPEEQDEEDKKPELHRCVYVLD